MIAFALAAHPAVGQTPAGPSGAVWDIQAVEQEVEGPVQKLRGQAVVQNPQMVFRAEKIEWNEETGQINASGSVYFRNFEGNEELWCDRLEYDTKLETGKFYKVRGQTVPKIEARPGLLTSTSPFHFEGEWAERVGKLYVLHNGFITNCKMPSPWWRLKGPEFLIEPREKATTRNSTFLIRGIPAFYAPYYYHSLQEQPRKSGFLTPNFGNSSRGLMLGAGYYWAINRSHDATYRVQDYTSRGFAHHVDLRGKPKEGSDYYAILYGVQDRGAPENRNDPAKRASGISLYAIGQSDLGGGWTARANVNYLSSFRFRQEWSQSYNEVRGGEMQSIGTLTRNWSNFTVDGVLMHQKNFQSGELAQTDPLTGDVTFAPNVVTIKKRPEAEFTGRDRQFWHRLPLWFSFESSAGLLSRSEPVLSEDGSQVVDHFRTGRFMNRVNFVPRLTGLVSLGEMRFVPSFRLYETFYGQGQAPAFGGQGSSPTFRVTDTNVLRSAREFSMDVVFPSLARVFTGKTFLGDKLKHVIEPRATYRYVAGVGADFNRFIRFDETELLADTNEVLISLTNRIYARRGDSVQEVLTWDLMYKRYFDPTFGGALVPGQRNVFESTAELAAYAFILGPRTASPVVSSLRISPAGGLSLRWQSDFDPRGRGIVDSTFQLDYRWKQWSASARNTAVRVDPALAPPANEYGFRVGFGDANRRGLNAAVDALYDYRKGALNWGNTQVTYNTDCCGFSIQFNQMLREPGRYDTQWRAAFTIANVGSFGTLRKQDRMF